MNAAIGEILNTVLVRLLRPLVRILLQHGISYHVFADLARWVYVDVALKEFSLPGRSRTSSRASVITGLSRKEVQRLRELEMPVDEETPRRYNRATRVISGWIRDPLFLDRKRAPLELPLEGPVSFSALVKRYSGDMPIRAVLDELVHAGAVRVAEGGMVKLLTRAYLPKEDKLATLNILGNDVADLITTISRNLDPKGHPPLFQRKVSYDNVPVECLDRFKELSFSESQALLEKLDRWLAVRDRDANPEASGSGRKRVGIGIYYFEADLEDDPGRTQRGGEA